MGLLRQVADVYRHPLICIFPGGYRLYADLLLADRCEEIGRIFFQVHGCMKQEEPDRCEDERGAFHDMQDLRGWTAGGVRIFPVEFAMVEYHGADGTFLLHLPPPFQQVHFWRGG